MKKKWMLWAAVLCLVLLTACAGEKSCAHDRGGDCPLCALEKKIESLPTGEEMLLMDNGERNRVYTEAQAAADAYYALAEREQGQIGNLQKLISLHEAFNGLTEEIVP